MKKRERIFLIDGIGAFVSTFLLGVVLPAIQEWIGMPKQVLYFLALYALACAIFSLTCFWFADHNKPAWLRIILWLNSCYCLLTIFLMILFFNILTPWGWSYFLIELTIILGLVWREKKIMQIDVRSG
ncbi:MAG: hypothetical protein A3I05_08270 [Deltaproteobacteria bacterium RIFCSPLOWO2_02_FULL_44_10]|nr:MAG: hypothetical protein A3I05_08270 [Deltaproteobacteria bacterium RIFCSPLOWO2_02_FULL_44_10]